MITFDYKDYRYWRSRGYSANVALIRARTEYWARYYISEFTFAWEDDEYGDLGDHEYWCTKTNYHGKDRCEGHVIEVCTLYVDGKDYDCLGSIIDPDQHLRREIETDMLIEYRGRLEVDIARGAHLRLVHS